MIMLVSGVRICWLLFLHEFPAYNEALYLIYLLNVYSYEQRGCISVRLRHVLLYS